MEPEFVRIEKIHNGVFPIVYLQTILKELDVNSKLSSLIISYLKKKTQKSFIDFQNLKNLIHKFSESYDDLIDIVFDIISYPREYVKKKDLSNLLKSQRPSDDDSSNEINNF
jgi:hypothetical protein